MLYYNFKNYEEFKQIFGIIERGNGVKSRRNKILLALYKDRQTLRNFIAYKEYAYLDDYRRHLDTRLWYSENRSRRHDNKHAAKMRTIIELIYDRAFGGTYTYTRYCDFLSCKFLPQLKNQLLDLMGSGSLFLGSVTYQMLLNNRCYLSDSFQTDDMHGVCEDGSINYIRYENVEKEHIFKMKAGRMFEHLISRNRILSAMPYSIKIWLSEQFCEDWRSHCMSIVDSNEYELHVDDKFWKIYSKDECAGYDEDDDSFGSCMADNDQYDFYSESVKAKAAYLTDEDGKVVARCILFTDVYDEEGNKWRLAERQYSCECNDDLKRALVVALIKGGYIDGYKRTTSSCHEAKDFVDNQGESLSNKTFHIECTLKPGGTLSYQDSFKYYDYDNQVAYNDSSVDYRFDLATTEECLEGVYCEHRDEYYFENDTVYTGNGCYEHEDDCICINNTYYYAGYMAEEPEKYGIHECPECGDLFYEGDGYYSDLTGDYYDCPSCMQNAEESYKEENWHWSEWDNEYYEDEEDIITAKVFVDGDLFNPTRYEEQTISVESFNDLVDTRAACVFNGERYIDSVNSEGEPAHYAYFEECAMAV